MYLTSEGVEASDIGKGV